MAAAAGSFDYGSSHLTRTQLSLDARGGTDLSRACLRLLEQVNRIEDAAKKGIARNPPTGDTEDVALVMMPVEAARLALASDDDPDRAEVAGSMRAPRRARVNAA